MNSVMLASEAIQAAQDLGIDVSAPHEVTDHIRAGLPGSALSSAARLLKIPLRELGAVLKIPNRSLARRAHAVRLSSNESDRLFRLARLYVLTRTILGDDQKAARWLHKPNRSLGGRVPLQEVDTEPGARAVEDALGRIAHGVFS